MTARAALGWITCGTLTGSLGSERYHATLLRGIAWALLVVDVFSSVSAPLITWQSSSFSRLPQRHGTRAAAAGSQM